MGSYNLLNDVRLTLTTSLDDLLAHAAERAVGADEGPGTDEQIDNPGPVNKDDKFLTPFSATVFQKRLPLTLLTAAAQSSILPKSLRRDVARSTWVRAVLLSDLATATNLQPALQELDPSLWKAMEPFRSAANDAAKHFAGMFIILQNPGLMPFAREGYLRIETLGGIDSYRDNWWCPLNEANWGGTSGMDAFGKPLPDPDAESSSLTWLTESQKSAASLEWKKLAALGTAPDYLAAQVLDRAKQDPRDPFIPQALHLAVRATRFGCTGKKTSNLSKAAFDYLHKRYPESEWAIKTKYYY